MQDRATGAATILANSLTQLPPKPTIQDIGCKRCAMRSVTFVLSLTIATAATLAPCIAQEKLNAPATGQTGVVTQGSAGVSIGGQPAARKGDTDDRASAIVEGSSNVFINGRPAATVGDRTGCGGVVVGGASNVFINGKPVARAGDVTTGCADGK